MGDSSTSTSGDDDGSTCTSSDPSLFQMARWPMPGSAGEDPPARYRVDPETTHDELTKLDWQRQPSSVQLSDGDAADYCDQLSLGGHCDWRLPTRVEAISLLDLERKPPSFDPHAFSDARDDLVLWSGSPERLFRLGSDGSLHVRSPAIAGPGAVRCVRGGTILDGGTTRYLLTPDLVTDPDTGLTWSRKTSEHTYADAASMCTELPLDDGGFRVPSLKELHTLISDLQSQSPLIDQDAFPNFPKAVFGHIHFWTSSLEAGGSTSAWMLDFATGTAEPTGATATFTLQSVLHVICVRSRA